MKHLRDFFGLTQKQIANLVDISRSHFSMIEEDKRITKGRLGLLKARMIEAYGKANLEMQSKGIQQEVKSVINDMVKTKIEDRVIQKQILMNRLAKMKKEYQPCRKWAEGIVQWKKIAVPEDEYVIRMSEIALEKLESKCNRTEQLYLEMQIKGIEAELNFISENIDLPEDLIPAFIKQTYK